MRTTKQDGAFPIKIWASDLEAEAEAQLNRLATMPFLYRHVAVMPDAHHSRGSTVGTVIATKGAIIPAAVGVDIGCGIMAQQIPLLKPEQLGNLGELRAAIEAAIPVGFAGNQTPCDRAIAYMASGSPAILEEKDAQKARCQLGTLGGGNHFIEFCTDEDGCLWIVLHSGSRNVGKRLAEMHINTAKGLMARYFISVPDPDLSYLVHHTPEFQAYIDDLLWAQGYAFQNRIEMMSRLLNLVMQRCGLPFGAHWPEAINCHHNYTDRENHFGANVWITRKGAIDASKGRLGVIPGSMGTATYIVSGKGNVESFHSAAHGAGRRMSRAEARRCYTVEDLAIQTQGVECRKDGGVLDEIPGSYKDIDEVMANQADLVAVVHALKQFLCVKG